MIGYFINPNTGFFNGTPFGFDLRPTRTTQYEIGFTQQISDFASVDITAYYKDIANQVVFGSQLVDAATGWRPYQILTNGDYATTQGIEINFEMRRTNRFLVNGSFSFQNVKVRGTIPIPIMPNSETLFQMLFILPIILYLLHSIILSMEILILIITLD